MAVTVQMAASPARPFPLMDPILSFRPLPPGTVLGRRKMQSKRRSPMRSTSQMSMRATFDLPPVLPCYEIKRLAKEKRRKKRVSELFCSAIYTGEADTVHKCLQDPSTSPNTDDDDGVPMLLKATHGGFIDVVKARALFGLTALALTLVSPCPRRSSSMLVPPCKHPFDWRQRLVKGRQPHGPGQSVTLSPPLGSSPPEPNPTTGTRCPWLTACRRHLLTPCSGQRRSCHGGAFS